MLKTPATRLRSPGTMAGASQLFILLTMGACASTERPTEHAISERNPRADILAEPAQMDASTTSPSPKCPAPTQLPMREKHAQFSSLPNTQDQYNRDCRRLSTPQTRRFQARAEPRVRKTRTSNVGARFAESSMVLHLSLVRTYGPLRSHSPMLKEHLSRGARVACV